MRPTLRPSAAAAASLVRSSASTTAATTTASTSMASLRVRSLSSTTPRRSGGAPEYDPPTGWLFGVKPGEKAEKEGWENLAYYGFLGSLGVFAVAYAFKPDTSIQTWALEEARRRLEAEGILEDPDQKK